MNEVETFAKAGEAAGAAVGTGVQTVRKGTSRAREQLAEKVSEHGTLGRAARETGAAAQGALADRLGALQETFPDQWDSAQELLAARLAQARRELNARLEPAPPPPPPRSGRRWTLLLLVLASLVSAGAAVVLARRSQPTEGPGAVPMTRPQAGDTAATHGNGMVEAENRSAERE